MANRRRGRSASPARRRRGTKAEPAAPPLAAASPTDTDGSEGRRERARGDAATPPSGLNGAATRLRRSSSFTLQEYNGSATAAQSYLTFGDSESEPKSPSALLQVAVPRPPPSPSSGAPSPSSSPLKLAAYVARALQRGFASAFLPQGYPNSVSADYMAYQFWDTVQAFCSYLTGTLAHTAVLQGIGVGNAAATASGATVTYLTRDGAGMLGSIVFAWLQGTDLDNNAKQWRLVADFLNDVALFVELVAPAFPRYFVFLVCFASLAKAVVGVAGGATRAALTQHQARCNNMGDVSAKDGSQERLVNLLGLLVGYAVTRAMENASGGSGGGSSSSSKKDVLGDAAAAAHDASVNFFWTWALFCCFTVLHLFANYRGVRALELDQLNSRRAAIVMEHYIQSAKTTANAASRKVRKVEVLTPHAVAATEPLLFTSPVVNKMQVQLGVSIQALSPPPCKEELEIASVANHSSSSDNQVSTRTASTMSPMLAFVRGSNAKDQIVFVVLHKSAGATDVLRAQFFAHALEWHSHWNVGGATEQAQSEVRRVGMQAAAKYTAEHFESFAESAEQAGWKMDRSQLGVGPFRSDWSADSI